MEENTERAGWFEVSPDAAAHASAPPPPSVVSQAPDGEPEPKVRPWLLIVLGVVLVVALAAGAFLVLGGDDAPDQGADPDASAVATTAPATTDLPVPTLSPTEGATPEAPLVYEGTGPAELDLGTPDSRVATVSHSGEGPFTMEGLSESGESTGVLVETEGTWSGRVPVDFRSEVPTASLRIDTAGPWRVELSRVESLTVQSGTLTGTGTSVVFLGDDIRRVTLRHTGEGSFAVTSWPVAEVRTDDVFPATTGAVDSTVDLQAPAFIYVQTDGDWTIEPVP